MKEPKSNGLQKRIDFLGRWAFTFFAAFAILLGWLGGRYEAGQFGVVFELGIGCAAIAAVASIYFAVVTYKFIKRLEALEND